jgi:hypothetical protein
VAGCQQQLRAGDGSIANLGVIVSAAIQCLPTHHRPQTVQEAAQRPLPMQPAASLQNASTVPGAGAVACESDHLVCVGFHHQRQVDMACLSQGD